MVQSPKGHKFSLCKSQYESVSSCMTCQCALEEDTEHFLHILSHTGYNYYSQVKLLLKEKNISY